MDRCPTKKKGQTEGGGGLKYAIWYDLTIKAEYLNVDNGADDNVCVAAIDGGGFTPSCFTANYSGIDLNVVRADMNSIVI